MKYYAKYTFLRNVKAKTSYVLVKKEGDVKGIELPTYADKPENKELGIAGKEYIRMEIPRSPSIRKYFAYTFVLKGSEVLTSVEHLNDMNRTFGDTKKIGLNDLILIQFSEDMNLMEMYFVKDLGTDRYKKSESFTAWCNGEELVTTN